MEFWIILRMVCLYMEACQTAEFLHLNRVPVNRIYTKLRERIAELCEAENPFENGEVELYDNYFGARRGRGKRGCGAAGKTPVFGMLKRGEKKYIQNIVQSKNYC